MIIYSDEDITLYNSKNGEIIYSKTIKAAVLVLFMKDNLIFCVTDNLKLWKISAN